MNIESDSVSWALPPPINRAISLALAICLLFVAACGTGDVDDEPASEPAPVAIAPDPPTVVTAGACVDPSASVPREMFRASVRALGETIAGWPKPPPDDGGSPPWPGLTVSVRSISGDGYSPFGVLISGEVPGIPGVTGPGDPAAEDFVERNHAHREELDGARASYGEAKDAAEGLGREIRRLKPPVAHKSDVHGCISGVAETLPEEGVRKLLVVSDLRQAGAAQVGGSLDGVQVAVVAICFQAARCRSLERYWRTWFDERGADVTFVRYERMEEEIRLFFEEV